MKLQNSSRNRKPDLLKPTIVSQITKSTGATWGYFHLSEGELSMTSLTQRAGKTLLQYNFNKTGIRQANKTKQ